MKTVKVRAYKKLGPTGKVEDVDAHMRKIEQQISKLTEPALTQAMEMTKKKEGSEIKWRTQHLLYRESRKRQGYITGSGKIASKLVYGN